MYCNYSDLIMHRYFAQYCTKCCFVVFIKYVSIFKNTSFLAAHYCSITINLNCKEIVQKVFKAIKNAKVSVALSDLCCNIELLCVNDVQTCTAHLELLIMTKVLLIYMYIV